MKAFSWTCVGFACLTGGVAGCIGEDAVVPAAPARDIVFTSTDGVQVEQLWRMASDGSGREPLTVGQEGVHESFAAWSPDGRSIALMSTRSGRGATIHLLPDSGGVPQPIGPDSVPFQAAPDWHPDGLRLAFSGGPNPLLTDLYVIGADGSDLRRLTSGGQMDRCPQWSPDGTRLLFLRGNDQLRLLDVATGVVSPILPEGVEGQCADWSPDGHRIVFASGPDRQLPTFEEAASWTRRLELFLLDLNSGELTHLPQAGPVSNYPRFSADGRSVVFQGSVPPGTSPEDQFAPSDSEIYVIRVDGTGLRRLTENTILDAHPAW